MTKIEKAFEALKAAIDEAIEDAPAEGRENKAKLDSVMAALGAAQKQKPGRKKGYRQSQ
jgi:hypothetical protein